MAKAIVIGKGPAGVSAAMYIRRGGFDVTVISTTGGSLQKAEKIENYYGFCEPINGKDLYENGIAGAERLGVEFISEEAVSLSYDGSFIVRTAENEYRGDAVVLATGVSRLAPAVKGLKDFDGKGVSYCAVCDGFFFRTKPVGVLGSGEYALNEVNELLNITNDVCVFTNGEEPSVEFPQGVTVYKEKLKEIVGETLLNGVVTENGKTVKLNGLFIAYKTAGSTALARKIGAVTENNRITVNDKMETNIKGLYAAGDCTEGMLQIAKAVYQGAVAGTEIVKYLKNL